MTGRHLSVRTPVVSLRLDVRLCVALTVLGALTAGVFVLGLVLGEFPLAATEVLAALVGAGDDATSFVVIDFRLPRALAAVLAGAALGIAGAIFQDLARNPLVAPDIIGISSGASLAAVTLIVFGGTPGTLSVPLAALGGALAAGVLLYGLAWRGGVQGYRLVLVGIGVAAVLQAGISYVLTRGQIFEVQLAYVWLVGSLNGRGWEHVWPLAAALVVLVPVALALGRQLAALQLGDDVARALGVRVERVRLGLFALATVLTGLAVSAAGPVAFVAFVAPHIARRLGATVAPGGVLPLAGVAGAFIVTAADVLGRELFAPTQIPVGIVTSILAAPFFLVLLRRADRQGRTG